MTALKSVHPFEEAGLGVAPFHYVGHSRAVFRAAPDAPAQPGASCDYCGTGIMDVFHVQGSDGRKFKVGCDCVRRTYAEFNAEIPVDFRREFARIEREKREERRVAKYHAATARAHAAIAALEGHPAAFADRLHPNAYYASQGKTYRDYIVFMLHRGGTAGKTSAAREVEALLAISAQPVA